MNALEYLDKKMPGTGIYDWVLWRKALLFVMLKEFEEAKSIILKLKNEYVNSSAENYLIDRLKILNEVTRNEKIDDLLKILEKNK